MGGKPVSDPLRLVVFDVDGTLVDSQHNIVAAMEDACTALNLPAPPARAVHRVIGLSLAEAVATLMPDCDPATHLRLAEAYKDAFVARRNRPDHEEDLFPGAREVLEELDAAGVLLGLATGKSRRGVSVFLERHGLEKLFITVHTPDDGPGKPHPHMLQSALAATGAEPALTVMVGDTTFDMEMARAAGVGAVGVAWGNHPPRDLTQAGASVVLENFADLAAVVRDLEPPVRAAAGGGAGGSACEAVQP